LLRRRSDFEALDGLVTAAAQPATYPLIVWRAAELPAAPLSAAAANEDHGLPDLNARLVFRATFPIFAARIGATATRTPSCKVGRWPEIQVGGRGLRDGRPR
jgi:hypothetical protein